VSSAIDDGTLSGMMLSVPSLWLTEWCVHMAASDLNK
jgi:hypothetical protein